MFLSNHTAEEREPKQNAFTSKAQADLVRRRFSNVEELKANIYSALVNYLIEKGKIQTGPFDAAINPTASLEDLYKIAEILDVEVATLLIEREAH